MLCRSTALLLSVRIQVYLRLSAFPCDRSTQTLRFDRRLECGNPVVLIERQHAWRGQNRQIDVKNFCRYRNGRRCRCPLAVTDHIGKIVRASVVTVWCVSDAAG